MIHNFIRMHQGYEDAFDIQAVAEADIEDEPDEPAEVNPTNAAEMRALNNWRNNIASAMWADYNNEREAHDMPRLDWLKLIKKNYSAENLAIEIILSSSSELKNISGRPAFLV